ncbi:nucleotidyltransferase domain-containing protein [Alsobacter sp. SYSU BS001988]
MRTLAPAEAGMDPAVVADIGSVLAAAMAEEDISIPWAIESGSRAWGFPSPDSDYDCRFIYVRQPERYLSLYPPRDVLELRQDAVLDVGGWDLQKTLRLLLKGNAVAVEWLGSPLLYRGDAAFRDALLAFAASVLDRAAVSRHYYYLGLSMRRRVGDDWSNVNLKKLFYFLRPALALRWLRMRPGAAVAPMAFAALCDETDLPADARREIDLLVALKRETRELGRGPVPQPLLMLGWGELEHADAPWRAEFSTADHRATADVLFRDLLSRFGPG